MVRLLSLFGATLAFTVPAFSVVVPEGQAPGVYEVTIDAEGKEIHTLLNATEPGVVPRSAKFGAEFAKRSTSWPSGTNAQCSTLNWLNHDDFYNGVNSAWNKFFEQCYQLGDTYLTNPIYSVNNVAVAYMCPYSPNPCGETEWVDAVNWVQSVCQASGGGYFQPGWLSIPGWGKSYGYANPVNSFC